MVYCNTKLGYFTGIVSVSLPTTGDWVEQEEAPTVPEGKLLVWDKDNELWIQVTDFGQLLASFRPEYLTQGQFRDRFTFATRRALDNYDTDETLSAEAKKTVRTLMKDFEAAKQIEPLLAQTICGLAALCTIGVLDVEECENVLTPRNISTGG